jgi:hypothetical protein
MKHYNMKTYVGKEVYAPPFLTSALGGGEWSGSRPIRITPGEKAPTPYPMDVRLGVGPRRRSGRWGEEKNLFPLPGIEIRPTSLQSVAIPTEIFRVPRVDGRLYGWVIRSVKLSKYNMRIFSC